MQSAELHARLLGSYGASGGSLFGFGASTFVWSGVPCVLNVSSHPDSMGKEEGKAGGKQQFRDGS